MRVELPIVGGYEKQDPAQATPADTVNMSVALAQGDKAVFLEVPGLSLDNGKEFLTDGGVRRLAANSLNNYMHAVVGNTIYRLDEALNYSIGAKFTSNSGYVGIDDLNNEVLFVDGSEGFVFNKTTSLYSQVSASWFPTLPVDCVGFGNRFFAIEGESNKIKFSDQGTALTGSSLNEFEITTYPDEATALFVLGGRLYVFGKRCTEVWVLQGGNFPVARDESLVMEYGCIAPGAIASESGVMCWVGYNKEGVTSVIASEGGMPSRISTSEVEIELQNYTNPDDVRSFMYINKGNLFYQLNFTQDNASWLYNFTSKTWSRLTYKSKGRHRANCFAYFNGKKYVGDYELPYLYDFSDKYESDNGIAINRKRITNSFYVNNGKPFSLRKLRFVIEQGVGTENGNNEKPQLMIRISRDNGATFGNQLRKEIGILGNTNSHTEFYQLGYFEYGTLTIEIEFYNVTRFAIMKCYAEVSNAN